MKYTAKVVYREAVSVPGSIIPQAWIGVDFYKDENKFATETFKSAYPNTLDSWIKGQIETYKQTDLVQQFVSELAIGDYDLTPPQPSEEQVAKQKYDSDFQQLKDLKKKADLGIIDADDEKITALRDTLKQAEASFNA